MTDFVEAEYLWLVVVGSFAAFAFGWGTGSNDVANAFGTSVGAKTLTLKQAVVIAGIFEFTGALVLGRVSTSTIAGGIANIKVFEREPEIYAYGMVCALTTGFVWQSLASYWELNVSATHSIIGAIMGFSLVYGGADAVNWATADKSSFPPYKGVVPIVLSWFVSPVLTGCTAATIFVTVRSGVLRREDSYQKSFWVLPIMVLFTTWINIYFVFTKGAKKTFQGDGDDWSDGKAAWVAACCAAGLALLTAIIALPLLKWRVDKKFALGDEDTADEEDAQDQLRPDDYQRIGTSSSKFVKAMSSLRKAAMHGMEVDIHQVVDDDPVVAAIHDNAEMFDPKAEYAFSYLQVFSAICVIFAHGAGEVGYMAGPLAAIWYAVKDGLLYSKVTAPIWCILISAMGLVVGLSTYGYNVTRAVGTRMAKLSPSRGFAAELATATVIMVAAQYGLPTSSSQCITGAIVGLGLMEGKPGVNWVFLTRQFASWIATLVVVGLATAALFAQGVFSPSISCNKVVGLYEDQVIGTAQSIVKDINSTLFAYKNASAAGMLPKLNATAWQRMNRSISSYMGRGTNMLDPKKNGTIKAENAIIYLGQALSLLQGNTIISLGQQVIAGGAPVCNDPTFNPLWPAYNATCPAPRTLKGLRSPYNATRWRS